MKDLILLGIQGSGKGTQADLLIAKYGFQRFETGRTLRTIASQDSDLGHRVKELIDNGILVPTPVIVEIVQQFLEQVKPGEACLFDGVPRSQEQYDAFVELMRHHNREYMVLDIHISEEEAVKRLSERKICPQCKRNYPYFYTKADCEDCHLTLTQRKDDQDQAAVQKRLRIFQEETAPILKLFDADQRLVTINGAQSIEEVTAEIENALQQYHVV